MPLDGPGCGKKRHPSDCLCDVHVGEPVPIMENWATDSFMARRIIKMLGLGRPWSNEDILKLLTTQTHFHDDVVAYNKRIEEGGIAPFPASSVLTYGQRQAITDLSEEGRSNAQIRSYMAETYGLDLDRTHVHNVVARHRRKQT